MLSDDTQVSPHNAADDHEAGRYLPFFLHHLTKNLTGTSVKEEEGQLLRRHRWGLQSH